MGLLLRNLVYLFEEDWQLLLLHVNFLQVVEWLDDDVLLVGHHWSVECGECGVI